MAEELALDAADDVGRELDGALRVAAVDSTNDGEGRDLHQILVPFR